MGKNNDIETAACFLERRQAVFIQGICMKKERYQLLDNLRGITLISMILYHGMWDLVYMFQVDAEWYLSRGAYIWQQSICWTFIVLSGFCWSLGRRKLRRALEVLAVSTIISLVTVFLMPDNLILFGVLSTIGTGMLVMIPADRILRKVNPYIGLFCAFGLFVLTRNVNDGMLGFESFRWIHLPKAWYANFFTAYLGFPPKSFWSCDYFSVFPWVFLYVTGYFGYQICQKRQCMEVFRGKQFPLIAWLGRHSLIVYALHQPMIYGVLTIVMFLIK